MEKWIRIEHPDLPDNDAVLVTEDAFVNLHEGNGWVTCAGEEFVAEDVAESAARDFSEPEPTPTPTPKSKTKK